MAPPLPVAEALHRRRCRRGLDLPLQQPLAVLVARRWRRRRAAFPGRADQRLRDVAQEAAGHPRRGLAEDVPAEGAGQVEAVAGSGDADVHQAPLLLDPLVLLERALVR